MVNPTIIPAKAAPAPSMQFTIITGTKCCRYFEFRELIRSIHVCICIWRSK